MTSLNIAVLCVSDSRDLATDTSGGWLCQALDEAGHRLAERAICADDRYVIRARVSQWIAAPDVEVVITTGGTGITGRDVTPEALAPLLDKPLDGFGELFRMLSYEDIGAATLQSRALAGVANGTLIFCLPGSSGAVRLGWEKILRPQLDSDTRPCNFAMLAERLHER